MLRLLLILITVFELRLDAQITLTNRILPAVGDRYTYHIDTQFSDATLLLLVGADQTWDLRQLSQARIRTDVWDSPNSSRLAASFPLANAVFKSQGRDVFYRITTNKVEELGSGNSQIGGGPFGNLVNIYPSPVTVFTTPANYQENSNFSTETSFTIPASFIPDSIFTQLPGGLKPDSIRIKNKTNVTRLFDSWGRLQLPLKTWDVLREKRTTVNSGSIEAKLGFLGWIDVTSLAGPILGGLSLSNTSLDYFFYSNNSKGFLASIATDTLGNINSVEFKPDQAEVATHNIGLQSNIELVSNLVEDQIVLRTKDLVNPQYQILISDAGGRIIQKEKVILVPNAENIIKLEPSATGSFLLIINSMDNASAYYPFFRN
ncbi:MAG: hypothetical protein IPH93_11650 [Saprospiraceae bacterium]|nr:hypothetical protein [Saprospiraceae bacterium]MBK7812239.1 hypothetical protein [Saprospiraceae bacterium]